MKNNLRIRRSLSNPLIQRSRRHSALATLFRSPVDIDADQPAGFTSAGMVGESDSSRAVSLDHPGLEPSGVPLVSASLIPVSSLSVDTVEVDAPLLQPAQPPAGAAERIPGPPASQPSTPAAAAPARPVIQPAPQRPPATTVQPVQAGAVQPKIEPPPPQPEPVSVDDENRIWNRLQSIFRKHQEKQAEESADSQAEPPAPVQTERGEVPGSTSPEPAQEPPAVLPQPRPAARADTAHAVIQEQPLLPQTQPLPQEQSGRSQPAQPDLPQAARPSEQVPESQAPTGVQPPISPDPQFEAQPSAVLSTPPPLEVVEASDQPLVGPARELEEQEPRPGAGERPTASSPPGASSARVESSSQETQPSTPQAVQRMVEPVPGDRVQKAADGMQPEIPPPEFPDEPVQPPEEKTRLSPPAQTQPTSAVQAAAQRLPSDPEPPRMDVYAPSDEVEDEPLQDFQAMPLEAAWPVQRLPETEAPLPEVRLSPPSAELARSPEARQVSSLLQDVNPGQPTDSVVEVVTPRRPRPVVPPPAQVQTSRQAELPAVEQTLSAPAASQEPTLAQRPAETPEAVSLIPTEIGALPADLWQLIGQEPPQTQPVPPAPAPAVQRQEDRDDGLAPTAADRGPEKNTAAVQPKNFLQEAPAVFTYQAPAAVQRVEVDEISSTVDSGQETGDAGGGEAPDIDELSRRVYQEVKRRLANEWERMRRRL